MRIEEIRTFLAIVKYGSITQAAKNLYVSQTTLSSRIKQLENELGASLFIRSKGVKSSELTQCGRNFIPVANKWVALWSETSTAVLDSMQKNLRIASTGSIEQCVFPLVVPLYYEKHPEVNVNLTSCHLDQCYSLVANHDVDAAFIPSVRYSHSLTTQTIYKEGYVLACRNDSAYDETIHPSYLDPKKEIYTPWDNDYLEWLNSASDNHNRAKVHTNSMALIRMLLQQDKELWHILPATIGASLAAQSDSIKLIPLPDYPRSRTTYILTRKDAKLTSDTEDFLFLMHEALTKINITWLFEQS